MGSVGPGLEIGYFLADALHEETAHSGLVAEVALLTVLALAVGFEVVAGLYF